MVKSPLGQLLSHDDNLDDEIFKIEERNTEKYWDDIYGENDYLGGIAFYEPVVIRKKKIRLNLESAEKKEKKEKKKKKTRKKIKCKKSSFPLCVAFAWFTILVPGCVCSIAVDLRFLVLLLPSVGSLPCTYFLIKSVFDEYVEFEEEG